MAATRITRTAARRKRDGAHREGQSRPNYGSAARRANCKRRLLKRASPPTKSASGRSRTIVPKAASISRLVLARTTCICNPMARPANCTALKVASVFATLVGLTSTATWTAAGTSSLSSSKRFATTSTLKKLIPVALPPGRARLATRPSLTGSSGTANTIGIVVVAALAAKAEGHSDLAAN